jgi:hypothetical protein
MNGGKHLYDAVLSRPRFFLRSLNCGAGFYLINSRTQAEVARPSVSVADVGLACVEPSGSSCHEEHGAQHRECKDASEQRIPPQQPKHCQGRKRGNRNEHTDASFWATHGSFMERDRLIHNGYQLKCDSTGAFLAWETQCHLNGSELGKPGRSQQN